MRPKTKSSELPSSHDVGVYIHNECVRWLKQLWEDTIVSSFLGMTAHWIDVKEGKWALRSEVVAFQGVSGGHDGNNLGQYFMGLCDCVGITSQKGSKVLQIWHDESPGSDLMTS